MKNKLIIFKKLLSGIYLFTIVGTFVLPQIVFALGPNTAPYVPLTPIGGYVADKELTDTSGQGLSTYLGNMYKLGVGIATALAVLMIMWGGIEYMSTDAMGGKENAKERINNALFGLLLALGSWLILRTINVQFINTELKINQVEAPVDNSRGVPLDISNPNYGGTTAAGGQAGALANGKTGSLTTSEFTDTATRQMALDAINSSNLKNLTPRDAANYFPEGEATPEAWASLMAGIASKESGFRPGLTYTENFKDRNGNYVISTGLLQISQESARAYGFPGITTEQLKDPATNLRVGTAIMQRWVAQDGCISCKDSNGNWRGGARYWSTLR